MFSPSRVTVRVPATSANLGPGFDCLGLALKQHNIFEIQLLPGNVLDNPVPLIEISSTWDDDPAIAVLPRDQRNLFYRVFCERDRKSTRLNSSHVRISYAVFCLKKKNIESDRVENADGLTQTVGVA